VSGLVCPAVATTICTTLAAHGLSDGDTLKLVEDTNYGAAVSTAAFTSAALWAVDDFLCVGTVSTTVTLNLEGLDATSDSDYGCGTVLATDSHVASTAAAPLFVVQTNPDGFTSAVTRTTSSAGSASYSWSDKHSTSGKFVTTATGASASAATHTFYRLDTAADFTEVGANNDAVMDAGDEHSKLVEWDATNDDFTILKAVGTAATHTLVTYMQYSYDANDQFVTGATVTEGSGTATTLALWETAMTTNALTAGGTYGDVALIDYEALSTGISQFSDG